MFKKFKVIKVLAVMLCAVFASVIFLACLVDVGEVSERDPFGAAIEEWLENHLRDNLRNYLTDEELRQIFNELFRDEIDEMLQNVATEDDIRQILSNINLSDFLTPAQIADLLMEADLSFLSGMLEEMLKDIDLSQFIEEDFISDLLTDLLPEMINDVLGAEMLDILSYLLTDERIREILTPELLEDMILEILTPELFQEVFADMVRDVVWDVLRSIFGGL